MPLLPEDRLQWLYLVLKITLGVTAGARVRAEPGYEEELQ
jgi:hypothetical protein